MGCGSHNLQIITTWFHFEAFKTEILDKLGQGCSTVLDIAAAD